MIGGVVGWGWIEWEAKVCRAFSRIIAEESGGFDGDRLFEVGELGEWGKFGTDKVQGVSDLVGELGFVRFGVFGACEKMVAVWVDVGSAWAFDGFGGDR